MNVEQLKTLGMDAAADKLQYKQDLHRKITIAYEHYKVVTPETFTKFNEQLRKKTEKEYRYDQLCFIPLKQYTEIPPMDCLMDLQKAREMKCFDTFEVAKIESVEVRKDPIIFGVIDGCVDKFFVTQWDDDVSVEEILEGGK